MLKKLLCFIFISAMTQAVMADVGSELSDKPTHAQNKEHYEKMLLNWSQVLEHYVDDQGRTDFTALAKNVDTLHNVVMFIERVSPDSHPELFPTASDVMAYHINTYNAQAMYGVIEKNIPKDFDGFFKRARFFKFRSITIGGKKTSLYDYENDVIRPLGDPRIHFALNCMVRDCPRLPQQPFRAATLEQQLDTATLEFFNKEKHLRIDQQKHVLHVSEILDFYTEDFVTSGRTQDLTTYINRYLKEPLDSDIQVKFIDYDWTINQQP